MAPYNSYPRAKPKGGKKSAPSSSKSFFSSRDSSNWFGGGATGLYSFISELTVEDFELFLIMLRYAVLCLALIGLALFSIMISRGFRVFFGNAARRRKELFLALDHLKQQQHGGYAQNGAVEGDTNEGAAATITDTKKNSAAMRSDKKISKGNSNLSHSHLFSATQQGNEQLLSPLLKQRHPLTIMVVLGSGGHTTELIQNLQLLGPKWAEHRCVYVSSENDKDSPAAAARFERSHRRFATVKYIPRARNVGQSYLSSIPTTLSALLRCFSLVWEESPDIILTNGPGVCIPVVFSSLIIATLHSTFPFSYISSYIFEAICKRSNHERAKGTTNTTDATGTGAAALSPSGSPSSPAPTLSSTPSQPASPQGFQKGSPSKANEAHSTRPNRSEDGDLSPWLFRDATVEVEQLKSGRKRGKKPVIAYFESFTCVDHLSLSGKILNFIADIFTVQWPQLLFPFPAAASPSPSSPSPQGSKSSDDGNTLDVSVVGSDRFILAGPYATFPICSSTITHSSKGQSVVDGVDGVSEPPCQPSCSPSSFPRFLRERDRVALVTVGSTKFDELISQVATRELLEALQSAKVSKLYVQKGRSEIDLEGALSSAGLKSDGSGAKGGKLTIRVCGEHAIDVEVFDYAPSLASTFMRRAKSLFSPPQSQQERGAEGKPINPMKKGGNAAALTVSLDRSSKTVDLLISHAGAGTILEALENSIPTIVVPNTKLMNNHQSVFAGELEKRGFLISSKVEDLAVSVRALAEAVGERPRTTGEHTVGETGATEDAAGKAALPRRLIGFPRPNAAVMNILFDYMAGFGDEDQIADARARSSQAVRR